MYSLCGAWHNGYQCGMQIPRLNSQHVPRSQQSWPFKARDCARVPPHAPCFVEVHHKYAPSKMFTLLCAPGKRTVCKKEELFCFLFLNNLIK